MLVKKCWKNSEYFYKVNWIESVVMLKYLYTAVKNFSLSHPVKEIFWFDPLLKI